MIARAWMWILSFFATSPIAAGAALPPADVVCLEDIEYAKVDGVSLRLDIARPKDGGPFPGIVLIHGGGWRAGNKAAHRPLIQRLAERGYVAASIAYRFAPEHPFPAQLHDAKRAVRWLRARAEEYRLDPARMGAAGDSAGGHLSLLLGLVEEGAGLEEPGADPKVSSRVQAVVNFYGPTDLTRPYPDAIQPILADLIGGPLGERREAYERASPLRHVSADDPPILTFHGTADAIVPYEQAALLHAALRERGVKERLETLEGAGHGWGGELRERTIEEAIRFFDEHLKGIPRGAGIFYNEDDSHRFLLDPPGEMKPERLDELVDALADSHVRTVLICCTAQKTNFPSVAWEHHADGFDPALGDDQPYFGDADPEALPTLRMWAHNLRAMLDAGVDPTGRMLERCRRRGMRAWVSIRMNDVHDADRLRSPLHSRFWKEHPECWRYQDRLRSWNDRNLNYALEPVRRRMLDLIREVCGRYRPDGLELDWNRFPLHFREGEEAEGARILTAWLSEVREVVRAAGEAGGSRIVLAARVPARPEVAIGTGLDAVEWARRGLIDHLIVAPFWTTTDFDIPVDEWIRLLRGTPVKVTAGLEARVQTYPGGPELPNTAERRRGAAIAALARGSEGIYLFNYFEVPKEMPFLLRELDSIEILAGKDRSHVITFPDIQIPGRPIPTALPRTIAPGEAAEFSIFIGPKPPPPAETTVHLLFAQTGPGEGPPVDVSVNGRAARAGSGGAFPFDRDALTDGANRIRVANRGEAAATVAGVELAIRFLRP